MDPIHSGRNTRDTVGILKTVLGRGVQLLFGAVIGLVASMLAIVVAILVASLGSMDAEPQWLAYSVLGAAAAGAWMGVGLILVSDRGRMAPLLFAAGVFTEWWLARGSYSSGSAYNGLVEFSMSCLGGGLTWFLWVRKVPRLRLLAVVIPGATALAQIVLALSGDIPGKPCTLSDGQGRTAQASSISDEHWTYIRLPDSPAGFAREGVPFEVTRQGTSGPYSEEVALWKLTDAAEIAWVQQLFVEAGPRRLAREIEEGTTPSFIGLLPVHKTDPTAGSLRREVDWHLRDWYMRSGS